MRYYNSIIIGSRLGAAVFNLNVNFWNQKSSRWRHLEFQVGHLENSIWNFNLNSGKSNLRRWKKSWMKKNEMIEIQSTVMDAVIKDDAAIVTSKVRNPLELHASVENSHHVESGVFKIHARSLQLHPKSIWSQSVSSPSQSCYPALSSGTKDKRIQQRQFIHTPVPYRQPYLSIQYYPCSKVTFEGLSPHPFQRVGIKGGDTWELIWGLVYSGSSYLQPTFFIARIFPVYTWGRHGLFFYKGTGLG